MQKISKKDFIIIIPARWKSSRFPGKPMAKILGTPMIERVVNQCLLAVDPKKIYVATDSNKIKNFCLSKNINVILTSKKCLTGTDRIIEVSKKIKVANYINIQGDEPLIEPKEIIKFINISLKKRKEVFIAKSKINKKNNNNIPKIVTDKNSNLLYISRAWIPLSKEKAHSQFYGQVNLYSFPREKLQKLKKNKKTPNEKVEDIEILRFIENNINVKVIELKSGTHPVDHIKDINIVEAILKKKKI